MGGWVFEQETVALPTRDAREPDALGGDDPLAETTPALVSKTSDDQFSWAIPIQAWLRQRLDLPLGSPESEFIHLFSPGIAQRDFSETTEDMGVYMRNEATWSTPLGTVKAYFDFLIFDGRLEEKSLLFGAETSHQFILLSTILELLTQQLGCPEDIYCYTSTYAGGVVFVDIIYNSNYPKSMIKFGITNNKPNEHISEYKFLPEGFNVAFFEFSDKASKHGGSTRLLEKQNETCDALPLLEVLGADNLVNCIR